MIPKIFKHGNFLPTLKYVLEKEGASIIGTNMNSATPNELAREFSLAKRSNPEFKNACAHIILSIPHRSSEHLKGEYHEHLNDLQYSTVGQRFLEEMEYLGEGLQKSQYVMGRHTDRKHEHIHIIASRVTMDATIVPDSWDYSRAEVAARKLEEEFGLEATPCSNEKVVQKLQEIGIIASVTSRIRKPQTIKQLKHTSGKPPVAEIIADAVDALAADKPTFNQLVERLKSQNIAVLTKFDKQNNIFGIAYEMDGIKIAGYRIGKGYSFPGLQKHFGVVYGESGQQATVGATNKRRRKRLTDAASIKRITASIEPIAAILNTVGGESSVGRESTSIDKIGDSQSVTDDASIIESIIDSEPINNQPDSNVTENRETTSNTQPNIGQPSNPVKPTKGNRKNQRSNSETRETTTEEVPLQADAVGADIQLQGASGAASNDGSNIRNDSLDADTFPATRGTQPHEQQGKQSGDSVAEDRRETEEISTESIPNYSADWLTKLQQEPLFQELVEQEGGFFLAFRKMQEILNSSSSTTPDTAVESEPTSHQKVEPTVPDKPTQSAKKSNIKQQSTTPQEEKLQQQYAETIAPIVRNFWHLQGRHKRYRSSKHELVLENEVFSLKRTSGEELAYIPLDASKPAKGKNLTQDDVQIFLGYQNELNEQVHSKQVEASQKQPSRQQSYQKPQQPKRSDSGLDL